jgi:hypothetical protein
MNFDPRKRSTADELLRHPFLEKAKGSSQIVERLLKGLEPLGERYAKKHGKANIEAVAQTFSGFGLCGSKIEWLFEEEEKTIEVIKKGRFTISRVRN